MSPPTQDQTLDSGDIRHVMMRSTLPPSSQTVIASGPILKGDSVTNNQSRQVPVSQSLYSSGREETDHEQQISYVNSRKGLVPLRKSAKVHW